MMRLDQKFQWETKVYRVSSIGVTCVIGTLISVIGTPKSHHDICILTKTEYENTVKIES